MCAIVRVCRHAWNERFEWERKKRVWVSEGVRYDVPSSFILNESVCHSSKSIFLLLGVPTTTTTTTVAKRARASFCTSSMSQKMCFRLLFHNLSHFAYRFWFLYVKALSHCQPLTYQNHCWMSYFIRIQIWCPVVSWEIIAYACVPMNYQARVCDMVEIVILERKK